MKIVNITLVVTILGLAFAILVCFLVGKYWLLIPQPPPVEEGYAHWSPDGQNLVYQCFLDGPILEGGRTVDIFGEGPGYSQSFFADTASDICIGDRDGRSQVRLTQSGSAWRPKWSPDGTLIAYLHYDGINLIAPDGNNHQLVANLPIDFKYTNISWSPKSDFLLFSACIDNTDFDIYVVDIETGTITNLTSESEAQDIAPTWIKNGTEIVFLSTETPLKSGKVDCELKNDGPYLIKTIDTKGQEVKIYDEAFYYASISTTDSGQIAFVSDMASKTAEDYFQFDNSNHKGLYVIENDRNIPTEISAIKDAEPIILDSWSPDGRFLLYKESARLHLLNMETMKVTMLPSIDSVVKNDSISWSPNSQEIALTVSEYQEGAIDEETHIYIIDIQGAVRPLIQ